MTSLDLSNYTSVFDDDFSKDTSLDTSIWTLSWGYSDDYSFSNGGLTITSYASEGWAPVGFMQADFGATSGEGYGLFSATASLDANQGSGVCIVLWPANGSWPGQEIDLLESSDPTRQTAYATVHWAGTDDSNQYQTFSLSLDLTKEHTYSIDWEPGSLTYYIDGTEIFTTTSHVPTDAAHGGVNETLGAEVTGAQYGAVSSSVSLNLYDMSYATKNATTTTTPTIAVSAPGTVQEASVGAGATVTETVTATGLSTIYEAVFTKNGVAETGWQAVTLNSSGAATFQAHFDSTGDYVVAADSTTSPTVTADSSAITLTDPVATSLATPDIIGQSAAGSLFFEVIDTDGVLTLSGDKAVGSAWTVKELVDGNYVGTVHDRLADGSWSASQAGLSAGTHSIELYLDGGTVSATASITVPSASVSTAASPMQFISAAGETLTLAAGASATDNGLLNTLVLPSAGSVALYGDVLGNGDTLDLRSALSAVGWDKQASDLGRYISATPTDGGADLSLSVHTVGSSTPTLLATLVGQGSHTLATVEQHSLLS